MRLLKGISVIIYIIRISVRHCPIFLQRERKLEKQDDDILKLQRQVQDIPILERQLTELKAGLEKSGYQERQLGNLKKQIQAEVDATLRMKKALQEQQKVTILLQHMKETVGEQDSCQRTVIPH